MVLARAPTIQSETDYDQALTDIESHFINEPSSGTAEAERFDALAGAIERYETGRRVDGAGESNGSSPEGGGTLMHRLYALILVAGIAAAPIVAQAADIEAVNDVLTYRGPVVMGDALRFGMNLQAARNRGMPIRTVRLNSPGGLVTEAMDIARQIRDADLDTAVERDGMCASACFLPFAAGRGKEVEEGARVGVHNATTTGGVGPDSDQGTAMMEIQAQGFGVPPRVLDRMAINPSVSMGWLSDEELRAMGASVAEAAPPVPVALTRPNDTMSASGNSWSNPNTVHYDAVASARLLAEHEGKGRKAADDRQDQAKADFNASPLHRLIMGE